MEAFSLLKYWRSSGSGPGGAATTTTVIADTRAATETFAASAKGSPYSSDGEEGPFIDLEFAHLDAQDSDADEEETTEKSPENEDETETESESGEISVHENDDDEDDDEEEDEDEEEEGELKLALASNECTDQSAAALSPSDELFFKGDLVSIEPSTILSNGSSEENSKLPVFLVKSATKFRVLLLKLKKSKSFNGENNNLENPEKDDHNQCKFMAVKFKVDGGPLASLFTRDNSSKENGHGGKGLKNNTHVEDINNNNDNLTDERKLTKEVVQKYLKMVKPFYVRVSKRYVEKLKFSGHLSFPGGGGGGSKDYAAVTVPPCAAEGTARANPKAHNLQAGLKVVRKHLGKSRSASATVAAAPPPKAASSNRRDDSLLQLQDGIQGAIMHCKRSFNASRDVESSSILSRSVSDPSYEKYTVSPRAGWAASSSSTSSFCGEAKETTV